jgi:hypothetical protein
MVDNGDDGRMPLIVFIVTIGLAPATPGAAPRNELVVSGMVTGIHPVAIAPSMKRWLVTVHVDKVLSGDLTGKTIKFAVHSPAALVSRFRRQ